MTGGRLKRDFTYVDDIVAGVLGVPGSAAARMRSRGC